MKGKTDMKMKKFAALAAATIMTVSAVAATSAFSVFATTENANKIVIKENVEGKTYVAYPIFNQTSATSTIDWANGFAGDSFIEALKNDITFNNKFADATTAADVASVISNKDNWTEEETAAFAKVAAKFVSNGTPSKYANGQYTLNVTNAGYYLIIDETNNTNKDNANSAYILNVSGKTDVKPKVGQPTLTKEIRHNEENTWGVVGDNQIGDDVEFRITTTIPSEVQYYDKYTYTIHDQLSEGFDLNADSLRYVYLDENNVAVTVDTFAPVFANKADEKKFDVKFDIKDLLAKYPTVAKIETYYSAKLNGNANVAVKATNNTDNNPNTAYLTYSNNPKDESGKEDGRTPDSRVYDWTFTLVGKKIDGQTGGRLAGAQFQLKDENGNVLNLVATDTKNVYRIATGSDTATIETITTDDQGVFYIKGIDDSVKYKLVEAKAPDEYNKASDTEFWLNTKDGNDIGYSKDGGTLNRLQIAKGDYSDKDADVGLTIENNKGGKLPSTGGIGTQIFYGVGGAIVVGAGVLLITKKRAKKD